MSTWTSTGRAPAPAMAAALRDECTARDNASGVPERLERDGAARGLEIEARFQDPRVKTLHLKKNYFFSGEGGVSRRRPRSGSCGGCCAA